MTLEIGFIFDTRTMKSCFIFRACYIAETLEYCLTKNSENYKEHLKATLLLPFTNYRGFMGIVVYFTCK